MRDRLDRWLDSVAEHPERWAGYGVIASIFFAGTVYSLVEKNASMPDGWWWAFVSMTTVGYGDFSPKTTEVRFLALFVIVTGIIATLIIGGTITARITQRRLRMDDPTPDRLDDNVMVVAGHLRSQADELEALAPVLRGMHDEEADDDEHWQQALMAVNRIETRMWSLDIQPSVAAQVKEDCRLVRRLAAAEGVTMINEEAK